MKRIRVLVRLEAKAENPVTFAGVAVLVVVIGTMAAAVPAIRGGSRRSADALRQD